MSGRGTRTSETDTETNNFFFFVIRRETELLPLLMRDGHPVGWPFFMRVAGSRKGEEGNASPGADRRENGSVSPGTDRGEDGSVSPGADRKEVDRV